MTINFQIYWWARCDVLHLVQTVSSLWAHLLNPHSITCTCLHFCFSQWWQRQPQRVGEYLFAYLQLSRTAQYVTLSVCPLLRHHSPTVICHVSCMKRHVCQVGYPWKEHYIRRTLTSKVMTKNWFSGILPFVYVGGAVLREGEKTPFLAIDQDPWFRGEISCKNIQILAIFQLLWFNDKALSCMH